MIQPLLLVKERITLAHQSINYTSKKKEVSETNDYPFS